MRHCCLNQNNIQYMIPQELVFCQKQMCVSRRGFIEKSVIFAYI